MEVSVFEFEYTFFNQRKEIFVEEDYEFLSPFIKMYPCQFQTLKLFGMEVPVGMHLYER